SVAKPVAPKQTGSVRADLNARPDLALRDGLLKQRNLATGPTQRNSGGHASDAGADHQSMKTFHRATSRMRGISEDSFETIRRLALSHRTSAVMPESPLAPIQSLARTVVPQLVENASSNSARPLDGQSLTKLMAASEPNGGDASGPDVEEPTRAREIASAFEKFADLGLRIGVVARIEQDPLTTRRRRLGQDVGVEVVECLDYACARNERAEYLA